jgi:hypothetical protein
MKTAIDYLVEKLAENGIIHSFDISKAKEMEKQQMNDVWDSAHQAGRFEGKGIAEKNWQTFEDYYNETFKTDKG